MKMLHFSMSATSQNISTTDPDPSLVASVLQITSRQRYGATKSGQSFAQKFQNFLTTAEDMPATGVDWCFISPRSQSMVWWFWWIDGGNVANWTSVYSSFVVTEPGVQYFLILGIWPTCVETSVAWRFEHVQTSLKFNPEDRRVYPIWDLFQLWKLFQLWGRITNQLVLFEPFAGTGKPYLILVVCFEKQMLSVSSRLYRYWHVCLLKVVISSRPVSRIGWKSWCLIAVTCSTESWVETCSASGKLWKPTTELFHMTFCGSSESSTPFLEQLPWKWFLSGTGAMEKPKMSGRCLSPMRTGFWLFLSSNHFLVAPWTQNRKIGRSSKFSAKS